MWRLKLRVATLRPIAMVAARAFPHCRMSDATRPNRYKGPAVSASATSVIVITVPREYNANGMALSMAVEGPGGAASDNSG
jgi:hypothetical protein